MANFIVTPNMNLPNPVPTVDPGPDYADNIQSSLNIVDQHSHTAGSGVQITTAAININASLPFNNQAATGVAYLGYTTQGTGVVTPVNYSTYFDGVEFYVQDGAGNAVQITTGGAVNATSSGISSGTATASFVGSVLVVNAATNKPANIQAASILLGNNVTSSNYLTLSPPNSMPSSFGLVLPSLPSASNTFLTIDTSGNIGSSLVVDNSTLAISGSNLIVKSSGVGTSQIADSAVTTSKIADNSVTKPKQTPVGQTITSSCGNFTTTSASPVNITNLQATITTSGRPVMVFLIGDGGSNSTVISPNGGAPATPGSTGYILFLRGSSTISQQAIESSESAGYIQIPPSSFMHIDPVSAGTYTYTARAQSDGSNTMSVLNAKLCVYEL